MSLCLIRATIALVLWLGVCIAFVGCSHKVEPGTGLSSSPVYRAPAVSYQDIDREELDYLIARSR